MAGRSRHVDSVLPAFQGSTGLNERPQLLGERCKLPDVGARAWRSVRRNIPRNELDRLMQVRLCLLYRVLRHRSTILSYNADASRSLIPPGKCLTAAAWLTHAAAFLVLSDTG